MVHNDISCQVSPDVSNTPQLSIIIVNWNTRELTLDCLASVYATICNVEVEVFVVDNASSDDSVEAVQAAYPQVNLIRNQQNLGFAKANNQALRLMKGRYALLLNSDAVLTEGAVEKLLSFMDLNLQVGMACGQLLNRDGSKQNSVANFPSLVSLMCNATILRFLFPKKYPSKRQEYTVPVQVDSCIGACLMVRKAAMDQVGLLDERYFFFMEETDWALTMQRAGWQSWLVPDARIFHLQGQSANLNQSESASKTASKGINVRSRILFYRSRYLYVQKWHPGEFPLWVVLIVLRLLINSVLNLVGTCITLGMVRECRNRLRLYLQLLAWHLRGCP
jgi:GT2 family glycosyltransferase